MELYNIIPLDNVLVNIITPFGSQTSNNFTPGKYGNVELYIMGLITVDELESRIYGNYKIALEKNYINQVEYDSRITTKELIRSYIDIVYYKNYKYFMGKAIKYTKENVARLLSPIATNSIKYNEKFIKQNIIEMNLLNIIYTTADNLNLNKININECETYINRFSSPEQLSNPYNLSGATEGKMKASFNYVLNNFQKDTPKNVIQNNNIDLITYFNQSILNSILDSLNGILNNVYQRYSNKPQAYRFTSDELIGICANKNKNIIFLVVNTDTYNKISSTGFSGMSSNYSFRTSLLYIIEHFFNVNNTNLINLISFPEESNKRFEYIPNDDYILKTRGCIKLPSYTYFTYGPYLHEFMHQYLDKNPFQAETAPEYNNKLFFSKLNNDTVHWGFMNTNGQLGGFSDLGVKILDKPDGNGPLISEEIIIFYNDMDNFLKEYDIYNKNEKLTVNISNKQIFINTIFKDVYKFDYIFKYNNQKNIDYIKYFIIFYELNFDLNQLTDSYIKNQLDIYDFKIKTTNTTSNKLIIIVIIIIVILLGGLFFVIPNLLPVSAS